MQENGDDEVTQKISSDSDEVTSQHELTTMSIKTEQEVTFDVSEEEGENESVRTCIEAVTLSGKFYFRMNRRLCLTCARESLMPSHF